MSSNYLSLLYNLKAEALACRQKDVMAEEGTSGFDSLYNNIDPF